MEVVFGEDELLQGGRSSRLSLSTNYDLLTKIDDLEAKLLLQRVSCRQRKKHKEKKRQLGKPIRKALADQILCNSVSSEHVLSEQKDNEMAAKLLSTLESQPGKQWDFRKCGQLQDKGCILPLVPHKRVDHKKGKNGSSDELCCSKFKDGELLNSSRLSKLALDQRFSKKNNRSIQLQHQRSSRDHSMVSCHSPDPGLYKICWAQPDSYLMLKIVEENSSDSNPCVRSSSSSCNNNRSSDHNLHSMAGETGSPKLLCQSAKKTTRVPSFRRSYAHSRLLDRAIAIEKSSHDPHQDFKDSMVEMILAKHLHRSNDLVELLQCYLSLNPTKCHHAIVEAFGEVLSNVFHLL